MSYPCKEAFEYPSYECYIDIKHQFGKKLKDNDYIDPKIVSFVKTYKPDKLQKLNELSDVFTNLKKFLSNHHVFGFRNYYGQGICNYISYLLCDKIRDTYGECDEKAFNALKEFVNGYNNNYDSYMCREMLNRIDSTEYEKLKNLYQFSYFYDIFTEFKVLMENIIENAKKVQKCKEQNFILGKQSLIKPIEENIQAPPIISLESEGKLPQGDPLDSEVKSEPPELTSSLTTSAREQDRAYSGNSQRSEVASNFVPRESADRNQAHEKLDNSEHESSRRQQSYVSRGPYGLGNYYESRGYLKTNEILSPEENTIVEKEHLELGPEKGNAGLMTKIQGAFSGFINEVQPGPVLGVSGGMGALFLLFKYTAVGSFFGGRRGRIRQIPRSFGGFAPGEFPNFQEYGVGHVRYSPMEINPIAE
ncbi:hypothetical protein PVC01_000122000 [Plasmodium vivax]|uniref:VIR protein n=1 Tax=Plasmodium vivax TaxID=5855 RepID=A0A1G4EEZ1_PLAVI|nr:hypothetical protein PVC01_000122000 [Plasmodium vivax]